MSIIKNKNTIVRYHSCKSLNDSLSALDYAFKNSDPERLVSESIHVGSNMQITDINNKIHKFDLPDTASTLVVSVGKASEKMLVGFFDKMRDRIKKTILIIPVGYELEKNNFELLNSATVIQSSHPIPNVQSTLAARKVVEELQNRKGIQLIVFLISGGSSSLFRCFAVCPNRRGCWSRTSGHQPTLYTPPSCAYGRPSTSCAVTARRF